MPRNGSGTHSIPNSFSSGTTISSSEMNANFTDIASEITNSVPRDGQAAFTGQCKITAGTAAAPGLIFSTDTDTGIYRVGADTLGFAVGGALAARVDSTGVKTSNGENYDAFPAGSSMLFYQASAPTGWTGSDAFTDGALRVVSQFSGVGGTTGGTAGFAATFAARTITQANLPNVNLTAQSNGAHTHTFRIPLNTNESGTNNTATKGSGAESNSSDYTTDGNGAHTHTVPLGGSGTPMDFAVKYMDVIVATKD